MNTVKISRTRRVIQWLIILGALGLIIFSVIRVITEEMRPKQRVSIGSSVFQADIADNRTSREKGLSGRKVMGNNDAMLFVYEQTGPQPIWMKDMNFPIDIVWIDESRKVVHIERNVKPDQQPHKVYSSKSDAKYVLEIAAGQANRSGIKIESEAKFQLEGPE